MTQAQVSRIENGSPIRNLDALVFWALTLRIPQAHLWFDLPAQARDSASPLPPDVASPQPERTVVASQQAWRQVRHYLNGHRSDLAKAAALLYQPDLRVGPTALLSPPDWLPPQPVDLGAVELSLVEGLQPAAVDGTEPAAQALLPLRSGRAHFDRYTSAIRYVDSPALFENRPSYRLLDVNWPDGAGQLLFGLSAYFGKIDVAEAIGHEYALATSQAADRATGRGAEWPDLSFRRLVDPFDLHGRHVIPAITTLTLCRERSRGSATFLLHWRDPTKVATAGGIYDVIPAGEFQPSSVGPWSYAADLDVWRNIVREYREELLGEPEHDGSRGTPVDYDGWPFFRALTRCRSAGRLDAWCLGIGVDALTLAATIPTVVVIDTDAFVEVFGEVVASNAEGITVTSFQGTGSARGIPFTEENVQRLLTTEPMAPPGAACIYLSWKHRDFLLTQG
jgi:hypothetical protein